MSTTFGKNNKDNVISMEMKIKYKTTLIMETVSTTNALKRTRILGLRPIAIHFCPFCTKTTPARLLWRYQVGACSVKFNGILFSISEKHSLDLQYGTKYDRSKGCCSS